MENNHISLHTESMSALADQEDDIVALAQAFQMTGNKIVATKLRLIVEIIRIARRQATASFWTSINQTHAAIEGGTRNTINMSLAEAGAKPLDC